MRWWLLCIGAVMLLGCPADETGLTEDPPDLTGDPNDPVICVGDPDGQVVCKKESEFWDCEVMPNGDIKCGHEEPQVPDGGGTWECEVVGETLVCKSSDAPGVPDGSSGWTCREEGEFVICEKDAPVPPGGGEYTCGYDSEFNWVCTGTPPATGSDGGLPVVGDGGTSTTTPPGGGANYCFEMPVSSGLPMPPEGYWAKIEAKKVLFNGVEAVYVRLTLTKAFVDNTYGTNAMEYTNVQGKSTGHSFGDLEESDKMELFFDDIKGNLAFHIAMDYISAKPSAPSGYGSLGVTGGDGAMLKGNAADVLAVQTSLSVNLNGYGYVLLTDSPKTDANYTPNPQYPKWIFDVWYETWIKWSAFGADGPGRIYITGLHASPNKTGEKAPGVSPIPCP